MKLKVSVRLEKLANQARYLMHMLIARDTACWVWLGGGGSCKANEELVDNVQEERHGSKPAHPTRREVTGHNKLAIIARHDHQGRAEAESPCPRVEIVSIQL